jgi:hypothetical protein
MDVNMNQIAKLDVIPSGRRIREVVPEAPAGEMNWQIGGDATKLQVTKINQIIEELTKVQHIVMAMSSVLAGASVASEGGDGEAKKS